MKIMIVDDNKDIVDTINLIMQKEGYETATAQNGEEFLKNVENSRPDLVLLDVMMPGLTTRQILENLKKKGLNDLKIILVTVVRFSDDEKQALMKEFKIVDHITKPFDVANLVERVKNQFK